MEQVDIGIIFIASLRQEKQKGICFDS